MTAASMRLSTLGRLVESSLHTLRSWRRISLAAKLFRDGGLDDWVISKAKASRVGHLSPDAELWCYGRKLATLYFHGSLKGANWYVPAFDDGGVLKKTQR